MEDIRTVGRLLKQVSEQIEAAANADLKAIGLTLTQSQVLLFLDEQPERRTSQRALEQHLGVSHATIHGVLARLEAKNAIRIRTADTDRRMRIVELNAEDGTLEAIWMQQRAHMARLIRGLDQDQVMAMLRTMLDNYRRPEPKSTQQNKPETERSEA